MNTNKKIKTKNKNKKM